MSDYIDVLRAYRLSGDPSCDDTIHSVGSRNSISLYSADYASHLDQLDNLSPYRDEFIFPQLPACVSSSLERKTIYLCGNSLGLQPKSLKAAVTSQIDKWASEGVEGHFSGATPWLDIDDTVSESMASLVGALRTEVVLMNSLTCNLHMMMVSFYQPTASRFKILIEQKAFPSDYHAVVSQLQLHGLDASAALLELSPREGDVLIHHEDFERLMASEGSSIALVLFSGVQYYTGQLFDMQRITATGHEYGCIVGFDLAHAVGNVPLRLHDWQCDFACWCTYKYMNCGPGSIGGCFVHEMHGGGNASDSPVSERTIDGLSSMHSQPIPRRLAGWWGHRREDRFLMAPTFIPCEGANGFRVSNPPVLLIACVRASLDIFDKAGMEALRKKSVLLTGYLEYLINTELKEFGATIFTPPAPHQRGCQLSISFNTTAISIDEILERLHANGVVCDSRKPNVLRVAPAPLYNSFVDVFDFICILKSILSRK